MQKWEYKIVTIMLPKQKEQELNFLGEQGWELVAWDHSSHYIFKRPKKINSDFKIRTNRCLML